MPTPRVINCVLANPRSLTLQTNELPEHPVVVEQDNTPAVNHREQVNVQRTLGLLSRLVIHVRSAKSLRNPLTTVLVAIARTTSVFLHQSGKLGDNSFRTERRLPLTDHIQDNGLVLTMRNRHRHAGVGSTRWVNKGNVSVLSVERLLKHANLDAGAHRLNANIGLQIASELPAVLGRGISRILLIFPDNHLMLTRYRRVHHPRRRPRYQHRTRLAVVSVKLAPQQPSTSVRRTNADHERIGNRQGRRLDRRVDILIGVG